MVKASKYLEGLPEQHEIPKLRQRDIKRLYRSFVLEGKPDMELLDEIESRLLARAEIWIDLNNIRDLAGFVERMGHGEPIPKQALILMGGGRIKADEFDVDEDFVLLTMQLMDMPPTDAWNETIEPYLGLVRARNSKNAKRRMLAVDRMINVAHLGGESLAGAFIEGDAVAFLDRLSSGPVSLINLQRRPARPVHVRSHRRRR